MLEEKFQMIISAEIGNNPQTRNENFRSMNGDVIWMNFKSTELLRN